MNRSEATASGRRASIRGAVWATGLAAAVVAGLTGCQRSLLSPEDERTPFEAYDSVRGQSTPQKAPDEFGRERVNLRQRLAPKQ